MASPKKASSLFIFVTVALDAIGIGVIIPSLPEVIRRFVLDEAQVSTYFGYFISLYALMQFLASPLLGSLSDRYGRRPVLLISLLGAGLDYLLMAFAPTLSLLFLGRAIAGLSSANFTVASAYMADVSDDSNRAANFGLIGAAFGLGFILGPAIGGMLGSFGPTAPFIAASIFNLLNFLFGLFILPESLPENSRRAFNPKKLNPFHSLFHFLKPSPILIFIVVHFLFQMAGQVHPAIWTLYTEHRFQWTPIQVGISLTLVGILAALVQGCLVRIVIPYVGEARTVWWGALGYTFSFFFFGWVSESWMLYATIIASSIFNLAPPALQGLISHKTPVHEQGELQGTLMSLTSLASIISPLIATSLFSTFSQIGSTSYIPGAPYFYAASCCLVSWGILVALKKS